MPQRETGKRLSEYNNILKENDNLYRGVAKRLGLPRAGVDGRLNRGRIIRQSIPLRAKLPYIYVYHTYPLNPDVGISHKLLAVSANLVYNNPITSVFVMT